ncbi:MAG TPA: hypothetical protein VN455_14295 [Methanotrichaceae archaeon]|nr:hypothetical protein [Methanotrichaceae archaeon]
MMKDDSVYLRHILDAIEQIESHLDGVSMEQFLETRLGIVSPMARSG